VKILSIKKLIVVIILSELLGIGINFVSFFMFLSLKNPPEGQMLIVWCRMILITISMFLTVWLYDRVSRSKVTT
jgi:hypothetical protein